MAGPHRISGNVDAWCGRCKLMLTHTVETLEAGEPGRVHCNTCKSQHAFKPYRPGESPRQVKERVRDEDRGPRAPQPGKARASDYDNLMKGRDTSNARKYSPKEKYAPGELISHPTFGIGIATALKDQTKVECVFPEGPKVLVHGR